MIFFAETSAKDDSPEKISKFLMSFLDTISEKTIDNFKTKKISRSKVKNIDGKSGCC